MGNKMARRQWVPIDACDDPKSLQNFCFFVRVFGGTVESINLRSLIENTKEQGILKVECLEYGVYKISSNGYGTGEAFRLTLNQFNRYLNDTYICSGNRHYILSIWSPRDYDRIKNIPAEILLSRTVE